MVVEYIWYGTIPEDGTVPYRIVPMMVTVVLCDNCAVARTNAEHYGTSLHTCEITKNISHH
jgi:hypothetical protein